MSSPLSARQRAELLSGEFLAGSGAPDGRGLARELFARLAREGIVLVDEPVRAPIGSRRRHYRATPAAEAAPAADGLGPPRGVRGCRGCWHPEHAGRVCGRSDSVSGNLLACRCSAATR